jgi:hypothetical protein
MKAKANGELKIEKGIPIPEGGTSSKGYTAALRKMEVGDSAVFPMNTSAACALARNALGKGCVTVRKTENGCRVWRIA